MMEHKLNLSIVSPNGQLFNKEVKMVTLPGEEGDFGVLPGHADTLSLLRTGVIEVQKMDGKSEYIAINWGYTKVAESSVDVLIDDAVVIDGGTDSELADAIKNAKDLVDAASDDKMAMSAVISKVDSIGKSIL